MEVIDAEEDRKTRVIEVSESSQVGEARRVVSAWGRRLGFDELQEGRLALVVTEAATNLVGHAGGGEILARSLHGDGLAGIEIVAMDRGAGMSNPAQSLRDGHSTGRGSGTGLGAIRRLSAGFDLFTAHGAGTAVLARVWSRDGAAPRPRRLSYGVVCVPFPGEPEPGDDWAVQPTPGGARILVADGLGHGPAARAAALAAVREMEGSAESDPAAVLDSCNEALRGTRGAAVSLADVDLEAGQMRYAGLGNVSGAILTTGRSQRMVSIGGTVGLEKRKAREFRHSWARGDVLVMASDGLGTHWTMDAYPGFSERDPALLAALLYRDHWRRRDDVTVLVARETRRESEW